MKHIAWVVLGICCAAPMGAEEVTVFTPSREGDAPVYMNGQLVRIDRAAGTITVRNDSGQSVLNVDRATLAGMGGVKPGSNVILGLRVSGAGSTERRLVTDLRTAGGAAYATGKASALVVSSRGDAVPGTGSVPQLGGAPEVAAVRELATRDFDMAVVVLAAHAAEVDRAWAAYRGKCVTVPGPVNNRGREWFGVLDGSVIAPTDDLCGQSYEEVARLAQGVESSLDSARDTARQADVLPGRMREVLQRYNLDL